MPEESYNGPDRRHLDSRVLLLENAFTRIEKTLSGVDDKVDKISEHLVRLQESSSHDDILLGAQIAGLTDLANKHTILEREHSLLRQEIIDDRKAMEQRTTFNRFLMTFFFVILGAIQSVIAFFVAHWKP